MNPMKPFTFGILISLGLASAGVAQNTNQLSDEIDRVSYAIGLNIGHNLKQQDLDLNADLVSQAIKAVLTGSPERLTEAEAKETLTSFQKTFLVQRAAKNKAAGEAYLAANKNQPGVQVLPDGLQYIVLTNGSGATPTPLDMVTVNYRGTLINGTEFDSSYKRGQPATFQVGGVIPGWTEALQKMTVGAKWKLFIPANLAYGEAGSRNIAPNSALIFEVELLETKTPPPPAAVTPPAPLTSDIIKVPSAEEMKKGAKIEVIKPEDAAKLQPGAK